MAWKLQIPSELLGESMTLLLDLFLRMPAPPLDCVAAGDLCAWLGPDAAGWMTRALWDTPEGERADRAAVLRRLALARCEGAAELGPCAELVAGDAPLLELQVLRWQWAGVGETVVLSRSWQVVEPGVRGPSAARHRLRVQGPEGWVQVQDWEDWLELAWPGDVPVQAWARASGQRAHAE